jgi:enoyl-[acyl-carrier protein] reductase I
VTYLNEKAKKYVEPLARELEAPIVMPVDVGTPGQIEAVFQLIRTAHLAEPLMKKGGTLFTITYYGSQMVVKNYNIMGVAKAALESAMRYLAAELSPKGIRVHVISPGPLATRGASEFVNSTHCSTKRRRRRLHATSSASTT